MKLSHFLFIGGSLSFVSLNVYADTVDNSFFPLMPRVNLSGSLGNGDNRLINGDGLFPLWGDESHIVFTDLQAKTGFNTTWNSSIGAGYRQNQDDTAILGGYAFIDRSVSDQHHTFWVANPGLESLGKVWDFRLNGYIPVGSRNVFIQQGWADNLGNYSAINFSGHTQYDQLANSYQNVGAGTDAEVGRTIPFMKGLSAFLGAYYYDLKTDSASSLHGAEGRAEYSVNKYVSVNLQDTYDNVRHNTMGMNLKLSLGGVNNDPTHRTDINARIEDPIQRNMANFMVGDSIPTGTTTQLVGPMAVERDNIWFFNGSSSSASVSGPLGSSSTTATNPQITAASCTYENPCSGSSFTQSTINTINGIAVNANYYLASGTYNSFADQLTLFNGQSIYGRNTGFTQPASGHSRPILIGQLSVSGSNTLDSIQLMNDPNNPQTSAIYLNNSNNIVLNNVLVGPDLSTSPSNLSSEYEDGIYMNGASNSITINNSIINAYANGPISSTLSPQFPVTNATGISDHSTSVGTITLNNSIINVSATSGIETLAEGITDKLGAGYITLNNSTINASATSDGGATYAYGLDGAAGDNYVSINNSVLNVSSSSIGDEADARGIFLSNDTNTVSMSNSVINATAASTSNQANAYGINLYNSLSTANVYKSVINASSNTSGVSTSTNTAYGIYADGVENNVSVVDSMINASATQTNGTAKSYGILDGTPDFFGGTNNISVDNSTVNSIATSVGGQTFSFGVAAYDISNAITIDNSHINASAYSTSAAAYASGVYGRASSGTNVINITDSSIYAFASSTSGAASADAIYARANSSLNNTVNLLDTILTAYASSPSSTHCRIRQNNTCVLP